MTDNEKMMLPLEILDKLSNNYGSIDIDELLQDKSIGDIKFIKEIINDLEKEGYIDVYGSTIHLLKNRFYAKW